jgi:hypothetical protein
MRSSVRCQAEVEIPERGNGHSMANGLLFSSRTERLERLGVCADED